MTKESVWRTVKLPDGLIRQVEKYIQSRDARNRGFTSISGFIVHAVRQEIESRKV